MILVIKSAKLFNIAKRTSEGKNDAIVKVCWVIYLRVNDRKVMITNEKGSFLT
jgi:hypothetical protein